MPGAADAVCADPIATDALIIGAGPAGLFQVFQLGLLGIAAHIVDSLPHPGGQCIELYADKPIYDIPSVPVCSGRELVDRLLQQIEPFGATWHLGQQVSALQPMPGGGFAVATSTGSRFAARSVVIAGGVGSFEPKRLRVDALQPLNGTQLLYNQMPDAASTAGRHVVVIGGDEAAVDAAIALGVAAGVTAAPASVALLHRRDVLQAAPAALERLQALRQSGAIAFTAGQVVGAQVDAGGRLGAIDIACADGSARRAPADLLLVFLGLSPQLGPLAGWGLAMSRKQLVVDTAKFETSVPGIFAVGDVNTYPGKKKLILSGFHEATLAAFGVAAHLFPEFGAPQLQYTTTSALLQRRLGVAAAASATAPAPE